MASSAGSLRREVLDRSSRSKINTTDDYAWYSVPRMCTHVDDEFLSQLTELYRQRIPPGGKVRRADVVQHFPHRNTRSQPLHRRTHPTSLR